MNDDLVYRMFVEMAVMDKKRDTSGNWLIEDRHELSKLLKRAYLLVSNAKRRDEDESSDPTRPRVPRAEKGKKEAGENK